MPSRVGQSRDDHDHVDKELTELLRSTARDRTGRHVRQVLEARESSAGLDAGKAFEVWKSSATKHGARRKPKSGSDAALSESELDLHDHYTNWVRSPYARSGRNPYEGDDGETRQRRRTRNPSMYSDYEEPHGDTRSFLEAAENAGMAYVLIRMQKDRNVIRVIALHPPDAVKYTIPMQVSKWIETGAKRLPQSPKLNNGDDLMAHVERYRFEQYIVPEEFPYDSGIAELFPDASAASIAVIPTIVAVGGTVVAKDPPDTNFTSDLDLYTGYESSTRGKVVVLGACVALLAAAADAGYHANTLPPGTDKSHLLPLGRLVAWLIAGVSLVWIINTFSQTKYLSDGPKKAVLSYRQK